MTLIEDLFVPLDDHQIDYCLLRNYEFLDGGEVGNDLDVLIPANQRNKAVTVLEELGFAKASDLPTLHSYFVRICPEKYQLQILHICWDDIMYCTLPIVDGDRILDTRTRYGSKPVWVPSPENEFVQLLFHSILNRGNFKQKYIDRLNELCEIIDKEQVYKHSQEIYGNTGERVVELAIQGNFNAALERKWSLVVSNVVRRPERAPRFLYVLFIYFQIQSKVRKINSRWNPLSPVPTIAFLGPDGTGKSTQAKNLRDELKKFGIDAEVRELGVYNDQSSSMKILHKINNSLADLFDNPFHDYDRDAVKSARRRGALQLEGRNGLLKSSLYFIDQLWRYLKANSNGGKVVIADRYIHDVVLYHKDGMFEPILSLFEGNHIKIYILAADTRVVAKRSEYDEKSLDEMKKRLSKLDFERIDVSGTPQEITEEVLDRISESDFAENLK